MDAGFKPSGSPVVRYAAAACAVALLVWTLPGAAADGGFPAQAIDSGNQSGLSGAARGIVRNADELAALTQKIHAGTLAPTPPAIDFSDHVVVYFALPTAERTTTRVVVKSATLHRGVLDVQIEIAQSDLSCLDPSSLAAPYAVASLPVPATDVNSADFEVTHKSYPCR